MTAILKNFIGGEWVDGSGITALAWDASGAQLAFGAEDGAAGILTLPAG